jgi:hypothetical protein
LAGAKFCQLQRSGWPPVPSLTAQRKAPARGDRGQVSVYRRPPIQAEPPARVNKRNTPSFELIACATRRNVVLVPAGSWGTAPGPVHCPPEAVAGTTAHEFMSTRQSVAHPLSHCSSGRAAHSATSPHGAPRQAGPDWMIVGDDGVAQAGSLDASGKDLFFWGAKKLTKEPYPNFLTKNPPYKAI